MQIQSRKEDAPAKRDTGIFCARKICMKEGE
jgi:hypothetical protein